MNTNQKNTGISFWLTWVLASTIGFGVGAFLGAILGDAFSAVSSLPSAITWAVPFGILFGAVGGLAQWLVIRRQIPKAGLWASTNAFGFMLAGGIVASIEQIASNPTAIALLFAAIFGITGGLMQWLILRRQGVSFGWWLAASILGTLVGITLSLPLIYAPWSIITPFGFGAVFGVTLGIITGTVLVWLLRHPKSGPRAEAATQSTR